jgi:predicted TIM-barrel fold metal-dependent hydrolase
MDAGGIEAESKPAAIATGGIDCDVHPAVPDLAALAPFLDDHWREAVEQRGLDELRSIAYPLGSPLSARPDWRGEGVPGAALAELRRDVLEPFATKFAICNCLYGVQMLFSEDFAAGMARAVNRWIAAEWLDRDARLRASIVVGLQNVEYAVDEIERCAADPRFVQVLLLVSDEAPLGRRQFWPVYAAAVRHRLTIGIHAGSSYKRPVTSVGWPSYYTEDYIAQAQGFQTQLTSLVCEGVFAKFPDLRVVLIESGVTWLPAHLWRLTKFWRGLRMEVPWVDRTPAEIVRDQVRLTVQPFDAPPDAAGVGRLLDQLGSDDMLLFSTDYPHWHYDGAAALPAGLPARLARKLLVDNPLATYPRLETLA